MKLDAKVIYYPAVVTFEYYGPNFGWSVSINGERYVRFKWGDNDWEPFYHHLPSWLTVADLDGLKRLLKEALKEKGVYSYMRVIEKKGAR